MRLWHQALIPKLPRQQLIGQHRECCALRGKGWGKKHATVDYIFEYSPAKLYEYHRLVMDEMKNRGYKPDLIWYTPNYRGKNLPPLQKSFTTNPFSKAKDIQPVANPIYPEHNDKYLNECLENLKYKGIELSHTKCDHGES